MTYVEKVLAPDERVVYAASLHWIIYLQGLVFTIAGGLLAFYAPNINHYIFGANLSGHSLVKPIGFIALIIVLCGIFMLLGAYIRQRSTELVITDMRVIAKYGFISRATFELMLSRVTGVNFDQTVLGRIMGFGTIVVHGAGGDISPVDLVADPQTFQNQLMAALEHAKAV
jgi:uncharacterized membrane protein YdbT with pleckstrin-like domain